MTSRATRHHREHQGGAEVVFLGTTLTLSTT